MGLLKDFLDGFSEANNEKPIVAFLFILFLLVIVALGILLSMYDGW